MTKSALHPLPPVSELRKRFPPGFRVSETLRAAGFQALWAGGCVRDLLLGREIKDLDIATDALPEQVEALFPHTHAIGKAFGVIQVVEEDQVFEVASFRQDLGYLDGRRPDAIRSSTPEEDAARRDFTINGLFLEPLSGELLDFVRGLEDLTSGTLRCIGEPAARFTEDHLRMLRAVRFASVLEFRIDPATFAALRDLAPKLERISVERIREELLRLLTESPRAGDGVALLRDSGLLAVILPELLDCVGCEQPPEFHPEGDVWTHTLMMLNELRSPSPALAVSVLLHDIGKPATRTVDAGGRIRFQGHAQVGAEIADRWMQRMKFGRALREQVTGMVFRHMDFMNVPQMGRAALRRIAARDCFEEEIELHRVDCLCSNGITATVERLREVRREWEAERALPAPWIVGADLLKLGLQAGPEIGRWKERAYERQLEGEAADRNALLAWLRSELGKPAD